LSPDDSLDQIELKLKDKPNDVLLHQDKAHVLLIMEQWVKAEAALKQVDELQQERDADTTYLYVLLYHNRGDLKNAFEISDGGIQQFPENHFQWEIRGRICKEAGKTEEAITAMTQSLRFRETVNTLNYIQIITILLERNQAGDKERTVALLQEGITRVDSPSELLHLSIRLNSELERYDEALEGIKKLEMHYGKQVPFAAKRAAVLEEAGRNAEAAKAYRSAIALLEALPEKKQNKQVTHLKKVFQLAADELSEIPDGQHLVGQQVESR
jgi:tetratricopeptide (TPR) repeat protein